MHQPPLFREDRIEVMHDLMRAYPFATAVTAGSEGIVANHLPFVLKSDSGERGVLHAHVARENPLWQSAGAETEILIIFQGPDHYITPSWYPSKKEHEKVVPTWNYAVVHAYGTLSVQHEADWLRKHIEDLVTQQEAEQRDPWAIGDAPDDFIAAMIKGIVGLEIQIDRLEGKWKVSQNRGEQDRVGVVQGLKSAGTTHALEMAKLIRG